MPRPRRRSACVPQFVPASRHEGVPLRRGQHHGLHLPVPRLELWHRRAPRRRAVLPRGLSFDARPLEVGARRGRAARPLQGHGVGQLGRVGAAVPRISRRFHPLSRPDARQLGRQRRRHRGLGRRPEMARPVQLEVPGGEFQRRQLSQHQPPLGRPGRRRPLGQRPARHAGTAAGAEAAHRDPRPRASDDRLSVAVGGGGAAGVPVLLGRVGLFPPMRGRPAPRGTATGDG